MAVKTLDTVLSELQERDSAAYNRAFFLDELRKALRLARGKLPQELLAKMTRRDQSEISRIENGVTNFIRFGSILDYLDACGANVTMTISDSKGETVAVCATRPQRSTDLVGKIRGLKASAQRLIAGA